MFSRPLSMVRLMHAFLSDTHMRSGLYRSMRAHRASPLFQDMVRSVTFTFRYPSVCLWHQFSSLLDRAMDSGVAGRENDRLDVKAAGWTESGLNMERHKPFLGRTMHLLLGNLMASVRQGRAWGCKVLSSMASSSMLVPVLTSQWGSIIYFTDVKEGKDANERLEEDAELTGNLWNVE